MLSHTHLSVLKCVQVCTAVPGSPSDICPVCLPVCTDVAIQGFNSALLAQVHCSNRVHIPTIVQL